MSDQRPIELVACGRGLRAAIKTAGLPLTLLLAAFPMVYSVLQVPTTDRPWTAFALNGVLVALGFGGLLGIGAAVLYLSERRKRWVVTDEALEFDDGRGRHRRADWQQVQNVRRMVCGLYVHLDDEREPRTLLFVDPSDAYRVQHLYLRKRSPLP